MTIYHPRYRGTVTKYVFVESPDMTPADLAIQAYEIAGGAMIKETCFGIMVTGREKEVISIIGKLRALDPSHIFVKDRGFPPGDPRRCRANLGGARPGFFGHEFEMCRIGNVSAGLERLAAVEQGDTGTPPAPPEKLRGEKLDVERLKKIIAEQVP
jgi:putative methanogenesis marker protein 6